jgi:hypothetical protein
VLFVAALITLFGGRAYFRHTGQRDLNAEMARLDAEDPGWRWDELQAAREKAKPPEAEDSARIVREARGKLPAEWKEWTQQSRVWSGDPLPLNHRIAFEDLFRDDELANATREARDLGLTLRSYPRGYHAVVVSNSPFVESLEESQGAREVAHIVRLDAIWAAQQGDPVRGLGAAHATLNAARSLGDEPTFISSLIRFAIGMIAAETAMRVLALTDSKATLVELAEVQSALLKEAGEPILLNGLRGERAITHRFLSGLNDGTISADQLAKSGEMRPSPEYRTSFYFRRGFIPEDQRRYLRMMTNLIDAAKGPQQEQLARAKRIEDEVRANWSMWYPYHRLMLPGAIKLVDASLRHRAELLSVAALIACERFRLTRGRWPESLAELPKDLLPAIPIDPYTGEPMKFARLPDGITVYATPPKDMFDPGKKRLTNPLGETEVGWRLYDTQHRGLPPLPKPKPEAPEDLGPGQAPRVGAC